MKITLLKKPKNVTLVEGFPGFGLIGTISIEFLMDHLKTEKIGVVEMEEIPAMIAIHQNKVIEPISIHYNKEFNMVLIHAINVGKNLGWKLADMVEQLAKDLMISFFNFALSLYFLSAIISKDKVSNELPAKTAEASPYLI